MNKDHAMVNNMAKAVIRLFCKFQALWSGKVAVEESINKLKAYSGGIDAAAYEQVNKSTNGLTIDKKEQRKLIISLTLVVITKVRPYARRTNNNELLEAVDYAETDLNHGKEDLCINRCTTVLNKGREYLSKLGDYGLTESDILALETSIAPFDELTEKRDVTKGERISATEKIDILVPLVRQELRILDDLVKGQMPEDFQSTYFNLR